MNSYRVSCYVTPNRKVARNVRATSAFGAAQGFAVHHLKHTAVGDGRMETCGPVHWSFAAFGHGQRIYVRKS